LLKDYFNSGKRRIQLPRSPGLETGKDYQRENHFKAKASALKKLKESCSVCTNDREGTKKEDGRRTKEAKLGVVEKKASRVKLQ